MAINFVPDSGSGNKGVLVSSSLNEGVDFVATYEVDANSGEVGKSVTVIQEGKREQLFVKAGEEYDPFMLSDGDTFNVIKQKYANG